MAIVQTVSSKVGIVQKYIFAHKIIASIVAVVVLYAGYSAYQKLTSTAGGTRYILGTVTRGTIISSVTASGQVSASTQLDIKPKVSGDIVSVAVVNGQKVSGGQLIAVIDTTDAEKAVRDAQANLDSAMLALQKTQAPADALSLTQAQNALAQAQDDLTKAYDTGFNNTANTFVDLPNVMAGINDILYGTTVSSTAGQSNIAAYVDRVKVYDDSVTGRRTDVESKYLAARASYEKASGDYKLTSRLSDKNSIENLINETYATTKAIADAISATNNFLSFVHDRLTDHNISVPSQLAGQQTTLGGYTSQINGHLSDLYTNSSSIVTGKRSIVEKTESLTKLQNGADPLDVKTGELTITQRQNALTDAKNALANYYIRSPFDGIIASLTAKKYGSASNGTALATIITTKKIAELSLNEVDAAKIKVGNKATLTFDALDGLSLTGEVASIDTIGTVSQGVVSYTIQIGFDSQDDRIKSGMTVNAVITNEAHQNALMVPSSAVKTQNGASSVQVFEPALTNSTDGSGVLSVTPPKSIPVEIGISDDSSVEILSGVTEGQQIVTRTTTGTPTTTASPSTTRTTTNRNAGFGGGGGIRL